MNLSFIIFSLALATLVAGDVPHKDLPRPSGSGDDEDHHHPHVRHLQNACDAEFNAMLTCGGPACVVCLVDAFEALFEDNDTVSCAFYEDEMCRAIHQSCTQCPDACLDEAEAFWECFALDAGCPSFACEPPTPSPTTAPTSPITTPAPTAPCAGSCDNLEAFNAYCQDAFGSAGARAACVAM